MMDTRRLMFFNMKEIKLTTPKHKLLIVPIFIYKLTSNHLMSKQKYYYSLRIKLHPILIAKSKLILTKWI